MASGYHIFLSPAGEDKRNFVSTLWRELENRGVKSFFDCESLKFGTKVTKTNTAGAVSETLHEAVACMQRKSCSRCTS